MEHAGPVSEEELSQRDDSDQEESLSDNDWSTVHSSVNSQDVEVEGKKSSLKDNYSIPQRPLLHKWERCLFLKKYPLPPIRVKDRSLAKLCSGIHLVNTRESITKSLALWRLISFLTEMHTMQVNRSSRRLFYSLTRISLRDLTLWKVSKARTKEMLTHFPRLRIFA